MQQRSGHNDLSQKSINRMNHSHFHYRSLDELDTRDIRLYVFGDYFRERDATAHLIEMLIELSLARFDWNETDGSRWTVKCISYLSLSVIPRIPLRFRFALLLFRLFCLTADEKVEKKTKR